MENKAALDFLMFLNQETQGKKFFRDPNVLPSPLPTSSPLDFLIKVLHSIYEGLPLSYFLINHYSSLFWPILAMEKL